MELANTLRYAAHVNRRYARGKLQGGAIEGSDAELIKRLFRQNGADFIKLIGEETDAARSPELLKTLAHAVKEYTHSYLDVIDAAFPQSKEVATRIKKEVDLAVERYKAELRRVQEEDAKKLRSQKNLDGVRIDFLREALREQRAICKRQEDALKRHNIPFEQLSYAAKQVASFKSLIYKLVDVLKYLGVGALGGALTVLVQNADKIIENLPALETVGLGVGAAAAAGVAAYGAYRGARRAGQALGQRAEQAGITKLVAVVASAFGSARTAVARLLNSLQEARSLMIRRKKELQLLGVLADAEAAERLAAEGTTEAGKAIDETALWLSRVGGEVIRRGWPAVKGDKDKLKKRLDVALSKLRIATEKYQSVLLASAAKRRGGEAEMQYIGLELEGKAADPLSQLALGSAMDKQLEEWIVANLAPARKAIIIAKEDLDTMEQIVNEFDEVLA